MARAALRLVSCRRCSHVYSECFVPSLVDYTAGYENSLEFSGHFQEYADGLARRLIDTYDLVGRDVLEIGSGRGGFLRRLCAHGARRGLGFDPSADEDGPLAVGSEPAPAPDVRIVSAPFDEALAEPADLVCCRHVLEHLAAPGDLLASVRDVLTGNSSCVAYFEVPNGQAMLESGSVWDVLYEHCSYFTPLSLRVLVLSAGFAILAERVDYAGQFLAVEARLATDQGMLPAEVDSPSLRAANTQAADFGRACHRRVERWQERLDRWGADRRRVVVWGAGSKGVMFLNLMGAAAGNVTCAVDVNPAKQGCFVAGTGHAIVLPEELGPTPPDVVIVMNPVYQREVLARLVELGVEAQVLQA